ncbi:MAG: hypothetical protein Q7S26_02655, partial [bacterium]|nr:hypothetical protein [bacterium]
MTPSKKILSPTGTAMLSARKAAKRLLCAPDYISKLCREGKLEGVREGNAWFVDEESIARFEQTRSAARVTRAQELSEQRRFENKTYQKLNHKRFGSSFFGNGIVAACMAGLLFSAVALAGSVALSGRGVMLHGGTGNLSASLAQLQSPFFGTYPTSVSLPSVPSSTLASNLFSKLFAFFSPSPSPGSTTLTTGNSGPMAINPSPDSTGSPQVRSGPAVSTPPAHTAPAAAPPTVIQKNTYPVIERTIEHTNTVSGITEDLLAAKLSELKNALQSQISQLQNPGDRSPFNNFDIAQRVSAPVTLTDATIPNDITASNYLPLAGGTLTGELVSTAVATSTFSNGINLLAGCFSINGVCVTGSGGGSGTPGGADTQVQFNDGGSFNGSAAFTFNKTTNQLTTTNLVATNSTTTNATSTSFFATFARFTNASSTQISASQGFFNSVFATSTSATSTFAAAITVGAGQGTSTFAGGLSVDSILNIKSTTASSTFANGINLTTGCISYNGTCLSSSSGTVTNVSTDSTLTGGPITTTGTLGLNLGNSNWWTALQNITLASTSQLTATSSVYLATLGGSVGVGTTSPFTTLSVAGSGFFTGTLTSSILSATTSASLASTTLSGNSLFGSATTTNFAISGISSGNLIKTTTGGALIAATLGTDYFNFAFPFTQTTNFGAQNVSATTTALWLRG